MDRKGLTRITLIAFIILINIGLDQTTKQIAKERLQHTGVSSYFGDTFRFVYAENHGRHAGLGINGAGAGRTHRLCVRADDPTWMAWATGAHAPAREYRGGRRSGADTRGDPAPG